MITNVNRQDNGDSARDKPLVIIPCGRRKRAGPSPAGELYLGPYFQGCLKTALALTAVDRIRILSGKYGLLKLGQVVEPYDQRIDRPGAITIKEIIAQARGQKLLSMATVIVLAGKSYSNVVLAIWPYACAPLLGIAGMGRHLARLRQLRGE